MNTEAATASYHDEGCELDRYSALPYDCPCHCLARRQGEAEAEAEAN